MTSSAKVEVVVAEAKARWQQHANHPHANTEAYRLFHGRGHMFAGLAQVVVNWFPPCVQIVLFDARSNETTDESLSERELSMLGEELRASNSAIEAVAVQRRRGRNTQTDMLYGDMPDEHVVTEHGLKYWVQVKRNQNVGLFLDMGHVRQRLCVEMQDAKVLNLFSYTCAFSVAALDAGAQLVVNNDMAKGALELGARNHALNEQDDRRVYMVPHNLFKSWWKLRKLGPYDVIIIDPPTNQRGSFVAEKSYGQILKRIDGLANPGACVVACLNSPFLDEQFLLDQMARWSPKCQLIERMPGHPDFPDAYPERGLKVMLFRYR